MIIVMSYVTDVPVASSTASVAGPSNPKSTRVLRKKGTTYEIYMISLNLVQVVCYKRVASSPINVKVKYMYYLFISF